MAGALRAETGYFSAPGPFPGSRSGGSSRNRGVPVKVPLAARGDYSWLVSRPTSGAKIGGGRVNRRRQAGRRRNHSRMVEGPGSLAACALGRPWPPPGPGVRVGLGGEPVAQQRPDGFGNGFGVQRLGENVGDKLVLDGSAREVLAQHRGAQDSGDFRGDGDRGGRELESIHSGHRVVCNDQVHLLLCEDLESSSPGFCRENSHMREVDPQQRANRVQQIGLVVDP